MAAAPPPILTEKPVGQRLSECISVLTKLTQELGIPYDSPEVQELKIHIDEYIKYGYCWDGRISFLRFGRIAEVNLPRAAGRTVEVLLRRPRAGAGRF